MTEEQLIEVAKRLSRQQITVENLGIANRPVELEKRVASDARYMIERDKLRSLELEYDSAMRAFVSEP